MIFFKSSGEQKCSKPPFVVTTVQSSLSNLWLKNLLSYGTFLLLRETPAHVKSSLGKLGLSPKKGWMLRF